MAKKQSEKKKRIHVTDAHIEKRRQKVFEMRLKGLAIHRIAEALDVTTRTIDSDISAMKKAELDWLKKVRDNFPADEYWMERKKEIELAISELWVGLVEQKTDRASVAKQIVELRNELDKCLRAVGITTTKVDPESLVTDTIRIIHEHVKIDED